MKAIYKKNSVEVICSSLKSSLFFNTDIYNISYCLSRELSNENSQIFDYVFDILKRQKSIRAVVQKFNAICRAFEI